MVTHNQSVDEKGVIFIILKAYLERLEAFERSKPISQRRPVPTMSELAAAIKVHPVTLSNIANNQIRHLNLRTAAAIIDEMRRRGFLMEISDLLAYRPLESER